ncbi:hypothetical protein [Pedobacter gandavensis]|uniref:Uncharacterized protein n=1 Tax=Pedobacter gandavensis TaxID=2679963 RepID=A0ABR6ETQ7_9SPHI|nr:hypothetical protein [Pedobacter gandavensis]MBB2148645.1 hypothetical protein [Pedobacter gandavensis]
MKKTLLYFVLLFPLYTFSQQVTDPFKIGGKLIEAGNYLGARDTVLKIKNAYYLAHQLQENVAPPTLEDQALAFFGSLVGDTYTLNWKRSKLRAMKGEGVNFSPAIDYIIKASKDQQVVMINEDHNTPKHRLLSYNLLEDFYALGYRYLAVEALENDSSCINLGYPQIKSGFYTQEPNMGNLLKKALKLGFKLVPYESTDETEYDGKSESYLDNIREVNQAKNLYHILEKDPQAKILVHAGHGHIWEKGGDIIFMAEYFRILSGINPLTINQSINSMDEFKEKLDSAINIPYVVLDKNNKPKISAGDEIGSYDLLVAWPSPQEAYGRKDYTLSKKGTHLHLITVNKKDIDNLVQVVSLDPKNDIPVDQFVVTKNTLKYGLALEKGQYYLQIVDKNGHVSRKEKINIL